MSSSRKSIRRPSRWRTASTRRSGPVGAAEKSGSTRAAKSGSVRVRQNARSASQSRFNVPDLVSTSTEWPHLGMPAAIPLLT